MFSLVVTEAAHGDLDEALAYIAVVLENPTAATAFGSRSGLEAVSVESVGRRFGRKVPGLGGDCPRFRPGDNTTESTESTESRCGRLRNAKRKG